MSQAITIELPDALQQVLVSHATQIQLTLEELIVETLSKQFVNSVGSTNDNSQSPDLLLGLVGTLVLGTTDLAENHDRYIGQTLERHLRNAE